jgi:hypothetical protein
MVLSWLVRSHGLFHVQLSYDSWTWICEIYVCVHIYIYIYIYIYMYVNMYARMYVRMHVCMYVRTMKSQDFRGMWYERSKNIPART